MKQKVKNNQNMSRMNESVKRQQKQTLTYRIEENPPSPMKTKNYNNRIHDHEANIYHVTMKSKLTTGRRKKQSNLPAAYLSEVWIERSLIP